MENAITILYLITSTNVGGTEKALLELIRRIDRKRFKIYVCSVKKPGAFAKAFAVEADGFYSLMLSEGGGLVAIGNFIIALVRLIKLIRMVSPTILHCLLFRANILGRFAGRIAQVPIIISSIRVIESQRVKQLIDRFTAPLTTHYLAVSNAVRDYTIQHVRIKPSKIVTIYNGINCIRELRETPSLRTMLNLASDDVLLGVVGRLHKQKGHIVLLNALPIIHSRAPHTHVVFCGAGDEKERLKQATKNLGLEKHVHFLGLVEDAYLMLSQMDIVIVPSLWEGMPNVILEAMAAGQPVVASHIAGIDEVVVDGVTGLLFRPGDPQALAEAILKLINNKILLRQMGGAAWERVQRKFQINVTVKQTEDYYCRLLNRNRAGCSNAQGG